VWRSDPELIIEVVTAHSTAQHGRKPWWQTGLVGYTVAAASIALVLLYRENASAERALDAMPLLLAAVGLAGWFGGAGPGVSAALLATLAYDYYFIPPPDMLNLSSKDVPSLIVFVLASLFFCWVGVARRRAENTLKEARDGLEAAVAHRTAELTEVNEQLRVEIAERKQTEHVLEQLAGRLIGAQEEERSRIGRELHDHVSQRLGILAIKIDELRMEAGGSGASKALDELRLQTSEITDDIHALSHRLHSSMLDHLGVVPALQRLVKECSERFTIPIAFAPHGSVNGIPSEVALCLFRVAEESLTNVAKHSRTTTARVDLAADGDGIRLTVADQGVGFDPKVLESKPGLGFVSIRERLRLVHGSLRVRSVPSHGTTVEVWVPRTKAS
jgi:signal transduction histidine kinase